MSNTSWPNITCTNICITELTIIHLQPFVSVFRYFPVFNNKSKRVAISILKKVTLTPYGIYLRKSVGKCPYWILRGSQSAMGVLRLLLYKFCREDPRDFFYRRVFLVPLQSQENFKDSLWNQVPSQFITFWGSIHLILKAIFF